MSRLTPLQAKKCRPSTKPADRRPDDTKPDAATAAADANPVIERNSGGQRDRELPPYRSLRRWGGRLGPVDYTLLAMVAVGIATTVAMAIFNPSG